MYFISCGVVGGDLGGWGALPADNTPAQRKTPLNPPPLLNLALGGFLSRVSKFREPPPPCSFLLPDAWWCVCPSSVPLGESIPVSGWWTAVLNWVSLPEAQPAGGSVQPALFLLARASAYLVCYQNFNQCNHCPVARVCVRARMSA